MTTNEFMRDLQLLIPPPQSPVETGPLSRIDEVEEQLNLKLPDSFIDFHMTYGSGIFQAPNASGLLQLHNPFSPRFSEIVMGAAQAFADLKQAEGGDYVPYDVHPQTPGLLPFGSGDGERELFWFTSGSPETWPVIVSPADRSFTRFDLSVPAFVLSLFTGQIDCWGAGKGAEWFKSRSNKIAFRSVATS